MKLIHIGPVWILFHYSIVIILLPLNLERKKCLSCVIDIFRPFLESIKDSVERDAYILMDMIKPPISTNYMVRPGQETKMVKCVSELGIFGSIIG